MRIHLAAALLCLVASLCTAQEQVDQPDRVRPGAAPEQLQIRVRITQSQPRPARVLIQWRRGGEGLGGLVTRGDFRSAAPADDPLQIALGEWTAPLPLPEVVGRPRAWEFPTVTVRIPTAPRQKAEPLTDMVAEFELLQDGKPINAFSESSPKGSTVGLVYGAASRELVGLSTYVSQRRSRLEALFGDERQLPKKFGIIGNLAGYGEGQGYGIRHCNPKILADDAECLRLLGMNGLTNRITFADAAGMGEHFRHTYWGGPGSGSPMGMLKKRADDPDGCPFDPALPARMKEATQRAIDEHKSAAARESWALWWDEIGVAAKDHMLTCGRCGEEFARYCQSLKYTPEDFGQRQWADVRPYPMWDPKLTTPAEGAEGLRYYCTFRFMTYATAQLFIEPAKMLEAAGIPLYAMQGPTPSWAGHSLDWHEFYDLGANRAMVFETSNRDPRVWQFESYLADIARGIAERHNMPLGCLIKPHRGAPEQRMLALVARGCRVFEWYTYGPDYAKGDSFSQVPELLERVGRAGRFLAKAEDVLYGAKPVPAQVAFISPRTSEIWGKASEWGPAAFEDAKWVYIALRHNHVPVDVLSEQQLAEGKLDRYKLIYVCGPNMRRDAATKLIEWVKNGGELWTDAMGLSRDEANRPLDLLGLGERKLQMWGSVEPYRAVDLKPFVEKEVPDAAGFCLGRATVGREAVTAPSNASIEAPFNDGSPAVMDWSIGRGRVNLSAFWAGLDYSRHIREANDDTWEEWGDPNRLLMLPINRHKVRPIALDILVGIPTVETILLDNAGRKSVALINWTYRHDPNPAARHNASLVVHHNLLIALPGLPDVRQVRSIHHGPLAVERYEGTPCVRLPRLAEIDVLVVD